MNYIIEFEQGVYFADIYGDPGRTLKIESAKKFQLKSEAQRALLKAKREYPHRKFTKACVRIFNLKNNCSDESNKYPNQNK